ncbi:hypothetical protein KR215_002951 [Drosophila sulfurigaster]|nr:hypothetical protein KR215_002951 [Drosophila sulfurigaster]
MHNVTPHGTTGVAPTQLMFNRVVRDKVPCIDDIDEQFTDSAERDRDCILKQKGKEQADKKRGAKEIEIKVGDKVFLKNVIFTNKLTPTFGDTEYEVVERNNNIIKITAEGKTLIRNVSHVKKIPITTSEATASVISPLGNARDNRTSVQDYQEDGENKEHRTERLAESLHQPLKLKLVNKGGMWESAQSR